MISHIVVLISLFPSRSWISIFATYDSVFVYVIYFYVQICRQSKHFLILTGTGKYFYTDIFVFISPAWWYCLKYCKNRITESWRWIFAIYLQRIKRLIRINVVHMLLHFLGSLMLLYIRRYFELYYKIYYNQIVHI